MRKAKFIATKDHFFMYVMTPDVNDEVILIDEDNLQTANNKQLVTFFSSGVSRRFTKDNSGDWQNQQDLSSPLMYARSSAGGGKVPTGLVNINNSKASCGWILAKENYNTGWYEELNTASDTEIETIENNPNQTVVISDQCQWTVKHDLDTFEVFEPEVTNPITEEDLNIDWGE